jgi:hypothetical protein
MDDLKRTQLVQLAQSMIGKYSYDKKGQRVNGLPRSDDTEMDCSEFVYAVYANSRVPGFPYLNSHGIARSPLFEKVDVPLGGDIVYWSHGHVAIVENPETGEFIGSQSSTGVARSNYKLNVYWKARIGRAFYRWKDAR